MLLGAGVNVTSMDREVYGRGPWAVGREVPGAVSLVGEAGVEPARRSRGTGS